MSRDPQTSKASPLGYPGSGQVTAAVPLTGGFQARGRRCRLRARTGPTPALHPAWGAPGTQGSPRTPAVAVTATLGVPGVRPQAQPGSVGRAGPPPRAAGLGLGLPFPRPPLLVFPAYLAPLVRPPRWSESHMSVHWRGVLCPRCSGLYPQTAARQASLSSTISQSLLKLMSIESVMPSISASANPFSSCPQYFPASGSFPVSWLFTAGSQSIGAPASLLLVGIQG